MSKLGVDVSKYQGSIDWSKVKADGIEFAILKATQKNNKVEPSFEANYAGCVASGVPVGCYRYVYATSVEAAKAEATALVAVINGKNLPYRVWLDMEDASLAGNAKNVLTDIIEAEAAILLNAGFKVGVYCNKDWYDHTLDSATLSAKYPFWIARYPSGDNGTIKESLSPKSFGAIWQYSSKGAVNGISGNTDRNIMYTDVTKDNWKSEASIVHSSPEPVKGASTDSAYPLSVGSTGSNVRYIQDLLESKFKISCGGVDSKYGEGTKAAVMEFQLVSGLKIDGCAGPATKLELENRAYSSPKNKYSYAIQRQLNLTTDARLVCDGDLGSATIAKCPTLVLGSAPYVADPIVEIYQHILNDVYEIKCTADGKFGPGTKTNTKTLQTRKNLKVDGGVGPATWKAISRDI